ncbi:MAG: carboxypeptidase-like regulatory domain-containing protein [Bacteroidetes bacterium]|nr:carboxypeptidase-like regulatory domain-containing protein [Bacteroidota bacterium]
MKYLFTTFFFFIFYIPFISGQSFTSGKIISFDTQEAVPYAAVYLKEAKTGVYSDLNGYFKITIPDSDNGDTLIIKHLGFENQGFPVSEINDLSTFILHPNKHNLAEIVVRSVPGKIYLPGKVKKKTPGSYFNSSGNYYQTARFISLDDFSGKKIKLRSVQYFIGKNGEYNAPFGVRLYALNDTTGLPGEELLDKQVIIQAKKKNAWVKANLDTMNIFLSGKGVFVAMEWLPVYPEYKYTNIKGITNACKNVCYGQVLGITNELKENQTFVKSAFGKWTKNHIDFHFIPNAMIYIEVEVFD